jgi:hypothetical protein
MYMFAKIVETKIIETSIRKMNNQEIIYTRCKRQIKQHPPHQNTHHIIIFVKDASLFNFLKYQLLWLQSLVPALLKKRWVYSLSRIYWFSQNLSPFPHLPQVCNYGAEAKALFQQAVGLNYPGLNDLTARAWCPSKIKCTSPGLPATQKYTITIFSCSLNAPRGE